LNVHRIMTGQKRGVEFLDDVSSDDDDYYEVQRKRALRTGSPPPPSKEAESKIDSTKKDPEQSAVTENQAQPSPPNNPFLSESDGEGAEIEETPSQATTAEPEDDKEEEEPDEEKEAEEQAAEEDEAAPARTACMYGANCYR
jgi:hypothetical protein